MPVHVPALLVQQVCGTGFELFSQAGGGISLGKYQVALCVSANRTAATFDTASRVRASAVGGASCFWSRTTTPGCNGLLIRQ